MRRCLEARSLAKHWCQGVLKKPVGNEVCLMYVLLVFFSFELHLRIYDAMGVSHEARSHQCHHSCREISFAPIGVARHVTIVLLIP